MSRYWPGNPPAVPALHLKAGDLVKLDHRPKRWRVAAVSRNFAALVQQAPFKPKGTLQYTVLDWRSGVRGPCDLIGWGYGDGTYSDEQCAEMLTEFEFSRSVGDLELEPLMVTQRNWLPIVVTGIEPPAAGGAPEVVHRCPEGGAVKTPCCDLTLGQLPVSDRTTIVPTLVTCNG